MQEQQGTQNAQQNTSGSQDTTGNTAGSQLDAGTFGGGNEGTESIRQDAVERDDRLGATADVGETGGVGGDGSSDDIGRTGTGSAMTGQTDVLGEEGDSGKAAGGF